MGYLLILAAWNAEAVAGASATSGAHERRAKDFQRLSP